MAPLHGLLTKKMVVPPTMASSMVWYPAGVGRNKGEEECGLFKLTCWSVLQNLVLCMWQLVLAKVPV